MGKRKIFQCSEDAVASCALVVNNGGVVVYPTDTIYGIGCDPYNDLAVKRIFTIKGRSEKKPLPILTYSMQDAILAWQYVFQPTTVSYCFSVTADIL
jgi:L-threonylcarbamoyladenylate synthase